MTFRLGLYWSHFLLPIRMGFIDFGFVTAGSAVKFCSCPLFDMDLEFLEKSETKWLKWLRGNVYTVRMFFKRSKSFHSSSEKLPLVRISVSWILVSTYLIWILGPKLIWSENKSTVILWVLDTYLMKGLLLFIIVLITASLFSKMWNWESSSEECVLLDTWSTWVNLFAVVSKAVGCALSIFVSFIWTLDISLLLSEALIESFLIVWDGFCVCFTMIQKSNARSSSVIQYLVI